MLRELVLGMYRYDTLRGLGEDVPNRELLLEHVTNVAYEPYS